MTAAALRPADAESRICLAASLQEPQASSLRGTGMSKSFKSVMAAPLNPVELVGDYGHIRPDPLIAMPGQSDRDTRVEIKRASAT